MTVATTIRCLALTLCALLPLPVQAAQITVAAAADLKFALDTIISDFHVLHPGDQVDVVYGSSGTFNAQIRQGAPYDLYFSADISYPRELEQAGLAASSVQAYAVGRLVLWSTTHDAAVMTLASLAEPQIRRVAIANPAHAPYGRRAEEALRASGLWAQVEPKLVYGENIAQTAQFVQSGNAQVGIIALALALNPELADKGGYFLVPDTLHQPLEQGFIITRRGGDKPLAAKFATWIGSEAARAVLARHGFVLPQ